jgi:hypothetical protein
MERNFLSTAKDFGLIVIYCLTGGSGSCYIRLHWRFLTNDAANEKYQHTREMELDKHAVDVRGGL